MSRTLGRTARLRVSYTQEPKWPAARNIARDGSHGLDVCTPQQRALRFFLGMLFFNQGDQIASGQGDLAACSSCEILRENIVISPWHDELVLLSDIHRHLIQKILPRGAAGSASGIPGLRCYEADEYGRWYRFLHLPTGGLLRLQGTQTSKEAYIAPSAASDSYRWPQCRSASQVSQPLTPGEAKIAAAMPAADPDLQTLIAGIVVRLTSQHPRGDWALGSLLRDPLQRGRSGSFRRLRRTLWKTNGRWNLAFNGPIPAEDIASALTDPGIGIPSAYVSDSSGSTAVTLGSATLHIRKFPPSDKDHHWLPPAGVTTSATHRERNADMDLASHIYESTPDIVTGTELSPNEVYNKTFLATPAALLIGQVCTVLRTSLFSDRSRQWMDTWQTTTDIARLEWINGPELPDVVTRLAAKDYSDGEFGGVPGLRIERCGEDQAEMVWYGEVEPVILHLSRITSR
ncbi:hypothetical protein F1D05_09645 [Kribbella qitaiheensis]|uniref:Uncharacterized protein n=1 Tax=Kribbella qitaiheensis TaxID=1544730 RepID=A0A7G6WVT8_9ACTN|nr:hypothetical protein [Kribbella qitaiheensis]QNE18103.1 hypothetical protein F1D05_09645 [Kribbella qitaiheensis]